MALARGNVMRLILPFGRFSVQEQGLSKGHMQIFSAQKFPTEDRNELATLFCCCNGANIALPQAVPWHRNLKYIGFGS